MADDNSFCADSAIGFLQRKSRFYGWSKSLYCLDSRGITRFSSERPPPLENGSPGDDASATKVVIGSIGDIDPTSITRLKRKQHIRMSQIVDISVKGQRDIVISLKSDMHTLRAQNPGDCGLWLEAFHFFSTSTSGSERSGDASSERHSADVTIDESQSRRSMATTVAATEAPSFTIQCPEMPALPLDLLGPSTGGSDSISKFVLDETVLGSVIKNSAGEDSRTMGWLPSTANLLDVPDLSANGSTLASSATDASAVESPGDDTICLQKYVPAPAPSPKQGHPNIGSDKLALESNGAEVDVENFDADVFFDEESMQSAPGNDHPSEAFIGSVAPGASNTAAVSKVLALPGRTSVLNAGSLIDHSGSCGFGDIFSLMQDPHTYETPAQGMDSLQSPFALDFSSATSAGAPHLDRMDVEQVGSSDQGSANKAKDSRATSKDVENSGNDNNNNDSDDNDDDDGDVPLGTILAEQEAGRAHTAMKASSTSESRAATAPNNALPCTVAEKSLLDTATVDLAGALIDNADLTNWDLSFDTAPSAVASNQVTNAISGTDNYQPDSANSEPGVIRTDSKPTPQSHQQLPPLSAALLSSPDHHRLGRRIPDLHQSRATIANLGAHQDAPQSGEQSKPAGVHPKMLSKYSDSFSSSRALLSTLGRNGRFTSIQDEVTGRSNHLSSMPASVANARNIPIVQYESVEPVDNGVSKVVRGQIARDIIEKEAERKPDMAVRRMRRVKSESKVVPLKAIRLKLNGSIINNSESIYRSSNASSGGLRHNITTNQMDTVPLKQLQPHLHSSALPLQNGDAAIGINLTKDTSSSPDAFGEFSEIRERLKLAEERKRLEQRARIHDKDGVDNVRIADIIQNRQDLSLAEQIEERRRMQLAKQQALLSQQLEQQRIEMETQRLNMELQQQHEHFKRQSLHPSQHGGDNYASQWMQMQDAYNGISPGYTHPLQPQPSTRPVSSQGYFSPYAAGHGRQMVSNSMTRPTTPVAAYESNVLSSGRPFSHYSGHSQMTDHHSFDVSNRVPVRSNTTGTRRQAGAAFIRSTQPAHNDAKSVRSGASTESWQSHDGHTSARTSIYAKTDPAYNGSVYVTSPAIAPMTVKRSHSFATASGRHGHASGRQRMGTIPYDSIPPVPPLPQTSRAYSQYGYQYAAAQGPHGYAHPGNGAWGVPPHIPGPMPRHAAYPGQHMGYNPGSHGSFNSHGYGDRSVADMQKMVRKRAEMTPDAPSLLQRLDQARDTGLLPGRHVEKLPYSQGAYQNLNANRIIREGVNPQYFGDGDTLLIDRVYESEKTRSALLKKISRNYTGIGGESAPPAVFNH
ncbi:hypothetical protein LPJ53_000481 [Coemansia erecta]|uniref:PH domain-containing protein n=1 Tax=Coemansia erecta TaxID=147472 RepID=A0A9W8CTT5_9FUNG|nr:hypothetical protein LPJ53_000481 [Coemansia erecta]